MATCGSRVGCSLQHCTSKEKSMYREHVRYLASMRKKRTKIMSICEKSNHAT
jgi:hypothetical protein